MPAYIILKYSTSFYSVDKQLDHMYDRTCASQEDDEYGGVAQLARAFGSYPKGRGFDSLGSHQRPVGQVVKTPPFHGGNTGSNPVRVIS